MSIKPGAAVSPWASMVSLAGAPSRIPMAAMVSPLVPMSPWYHGLPDPSTMWAWRMTMSKDWTWKRKLNAASGNIHVIVHGVAAHGAALHLLVPFCHASVSGWYSESLLGDEESIDKKR